MGTTVAQNDPVSGVAAAVCRSWWVHGEVVEAQSWADVGPTLGARSDDEVIKSVVLVESRHSADVILDGYTKLESAREDLAALVERGWQVDALLPLGCLGAAHEAFRGLPIHIQGWWQPVGGAVAFSAPEIP